MRRVPMLPLAAAAIACAGVYAAAQQPAAPNRFLNEPLIPGVYTADPSAHVFNGRLYIYPSHDIDAGVPADLAWPFLRRAAALDEASWQDVTCECLALPAYRGLAITMALTMPTPPPALLERTLARLEGYGPLVDTACLRGDVPETTLGLLLRHPDPAIAGATLDVQVVGGRAEQGYRLLDVAPGGGNADPEAGCEAGVGVAVAQMGQGEQGLSRRVPPGSALLAVAADAFGQVVQGPAGQRDRGRVGQHGEAPDRGFGSRSTAVLSGA